MIKRYMLLTIALTAIWADAAPAPQPVTLDSRAANSPPLFAYQGNQRTFRVTFRDGTNAVSLTNCTPYLLWATSNRSGAFVTSTVAWIDQSNGVADFTFNAAQLSTNGSMIYEGGIRDYPVTYRQGSFAIIPSPYGAGTNIAFTTAINWDLYSFLGTFPIVNGGTSGSTGTVSQAAGEITIGFPSPIGKIDSVNGVASNLTIHEHLILTTNGPNYPPWLEWFGAGYRTRLRPLEGALFDQDYDFYLPEEFSGNCLATTGKVAAMIVAATNSLDLQQITDGGNFTTDTIAAAGFTIGGNSCLTSAVGANTINITGSVTAVGLYSPSANVQGYAVNSVGNGSSNVPAFAVGSSGGMYSPYATNISFAAGQVEMMRLNGITRSIGILTNATAYTLDVMGTTHIESNITVGGSVAAAGFTIGGNSVLTNAVGAIPILSGTASNLSVYNGMTIASNTPFYDKELPWLTWSVGNGQYKRRLRPEIGSYGDSDCDFLIRDIGGGGYLAMENITNGLTGINDTIARVVAATNALTSRRWTNVLTFSRMTITNDGLNYISTYMAYTGTVIAVRCKSVSGTAYGSIYLRRPWTNSATIVILSNAVWATTGNVYVLNSAYAIGDKIGGVITNMAAGTTNCMTDISEVHP